MTKEELKVLFASGSIPTGDDFATLIEELQGAKGERGDDGRPFVFSDFTQEQLNTLRGKDGYTPQKNTDYFDGKDGKTAYEIALGNGFLGDELTWLESLRGDRGEKGESGLIHAQSSNSLKLWKGTATVGKDGKWSINYSDALFMSVIAVVPVFSANANDSDAAGMAIGGGLINSTITNVSVQGYAVKGLSAGLLAAMTSTWASEGTTVHVLVIGY